MHNPYCQRRLEYVLFLQNRRTRITSATENEKKSKVYRHLSEHPCLREGFAACIHLACTPLHQSDANVPRTDDAVGISLVGTENT